MAHKIAEIVDVSPWEALLLAVKRAAAWAAFYDTKLAAVESDDDLRPGEAANDWVRAAERVNDKLARYAKMAVDAGVAQMLVQQAKSDGALIAQVLNRALGDAELGEEAEMKMRAALRRALMELGPQTSVEGRTTVVDGEVL